MNASGAVRGMVELSYVSEPLTITPALGVVIGSQTQSVDSLGKKMKITFNLTTALPSSKMELADYNYPGIGNLEIIRAELYDGNGKLLSIFSDPLSIKVTP
jgi:hypothetical protein